VAATKDISTTIPSPPPIRILPLKNGTESVDLESLDCTPPSAAQIQNETNAWLNRKLNRYAKLRQVKLAAKPSLGRELKRIRSLALLDVMKEITIKSCPFTSSDFLEQALDLFLVLHQVQDLHVSLDLPPVNFEWIHQILNACSKEARPLNLYVETGPIGCEESEYVNPLEIRHIHSLLS